MENYMNGINAPMGINNHHLKSLIDKTDIAFKALQKDPQNPFLFEIYEDTKRELDSYVASVKGSLSTKLP